MREFLYKVVVPKHYRPSWSPSKATKIIGTVLFWVNVATNYSRSQQLNKLRYENAEFRKQLGLPPAPPGPVVKWLADMQQHVQGS